MQSMIILLTTLVSINYASMQLFVQNGDTQIAIEVANDATVGDLINAFCDATGNEASQTTMTHQGQELRDRAALLSDAGVSAESALECKMRVVEFASQRISHERDCSINYSITVGADGFKEEIFRQTHEQLHPNGDDRIDYWLVFNKASASEYLSMNNPAIEGEQCRLIDQQMIQQIKSSEAFNETGSSSLKVVHLLGNNDEAPGPGANRYDIVIEIPFDLGILFVNSPWA